MERGQGGSCEVAAAHQGAIAIGRQREKLILMCCFVPPGLVQFGGFPLGMHTTRERCFKKLRIHVTVIHGMQTVCLG